MDKLQECAKSFEHLLDKKYHIIIGRKGKSADIELSFDIVDFHHLVGLHKLKDLQISVENREKVFRDILAGHISFSDLKKSDFFRQMGNRIEPFTGLEHILDDNRLIFKYNEKANSFSLIQAEYLLSTPYKANEIYVFLDKKDDDKFFCRSFFPKEHKDYTLRQPTYTLLFKEKITISTGEKEVQYDRLSQLQKKTDLTIEQTVSKENLSIAPPEKKKKTFADVKANALKKAEAYNKSVEIKEKSIPMKSDPEL